MSYCIAFSVDGATDVTRRYVQDPIAHGLDRSRAPEEVLLYIINVIRDMRRASSSMEDRQRLTQEDEREEGELRSCVISNLTALIEKMIPTVRPSLATGSEIKVLPARQTGTEAWRRARGENGEGLEGSGPDLPTQQDQ